MEIVIDDEFKNLLSPLTDYELQQLKENLFADAALTAPVSQVIELTGRQYGFSQTVLDFKDNTPEIKVTVTIPNNVKNKQAKINQIYDILTTKK